MTKLVFVYNADSGFMNGMFDFFHKMMKPSTYSCDLCTITHNHTGMRKAWRSYLKSLNIEKDYLHKDEFRKLYPEHSQTELPAIFLLKEDLKMIISSEELKDADLSQLTSMLKEKIVSCRVRI